MTVRNLEYAFRPRSVAVFGASDRGETVGGVVAKNMLEGGFGGDVWFVNPKHATVRSHPCYPDARSLPGVPDFAVIATPPNTVPKVVADLGVKGCRAAVVITAGITRENGLCQAMLDAARPNLLRIIGPDTIGLMIPPLNLNASFAHMAPKVGNIALLSQSGAIAGSLVDWAAEHDVGFSCVVSLGDIADVDAADWLDLLAGDAHTRVILMYLESVANPRKFISAARIEIDPAAVEQPGPNPKLAIRPYPAQWERSFSKNGDRYQIRPIKPVDINLYPDFLAKISPDDIRLRFLAARRAFPDEMLKRLTQLDYDRDMAFVALNVESKTLVGIARRSSTSIREVPGETHFVVKARMSATVSPGLLDASSRCHVMLPVSFCSCRFRTAMVASEGPPTRPSTRRRSRPAGASSQTPWNGTPRLAATYSMRSR